MTTSLSVLVGDTWNTVSPIRCSGCGRPDVVLCHTCARELTPTVHHPTLAIRRALFNVPVVAGTHYRGVVRRALTSFKERGVVGVGKYFAVILRAAVSSLHQEVSLTGVTIVCVPHSRAGWLKRGRHPTRDLVKRAGWARSLAPISALRTQTEVGGFSVVERQKTKSRRDRLNLPPRFVGSVDLRGHRVLLVDDVLTTGISLEYAARAITLCGGVVVGGAVVAATPGSGETGSM
jgi:predicted amidophosphoribosyltransferase